MYPEKNVQRLLQTNFKIEWEDCHSIIRPVLLRSPEVCVYS